MEHSNISYGQDVHNSKLIIKAGQADHNYWRDLWRYRELFLFLVWRDINVRYKQTLIGIGWSVIRPVLVMLVFSFVFGGLAKLPSDGVPYPILVFSAMLPWQFFSNAFTEAGNSLISNTSMISKVYFPRIIIPVSSIIVCLVDFFIALFILACLMLWYGYYPNWQILALPILMVFCFFTILAASLWIAALNVKYRDFRYVIPFIVQMGMYISPVGFSSNVVPDQWRFLYSINPMVDVIDGFRWAILGDVTQFYWPGFLFSIFLVAVILITGVRYFRNTERYFADMI